VQTAIIELPGPRFVLAFVSPRLGHPPPRLARLGELKSGPGALRERDFQVDEHALDRVHRVIAERGVECPGVLAEARRVGDGYVYVVDQRTPSDTEVSTRDVLGAFETRSGTPGRYIASADYRVVTEHGAMQLDPWLFDAIVDALAPEASRDALELP
jgi:hypothetical protein